MVKINAPVVTNLDTDLLSTAHSLPLISHNNNMHATIVSFNVPCLCSAKYFHTDDLSNNLWERHYHTHFTDQKTEVQVSFTGV